MFDADNSYFLGDEASFQKKEAELAKRLVCFKIYLTKVLCIHVPMAVDAARASPM